jgi:hypothetical protein
MFNKLLFFREEICHVTRPCPFLCTHVAAWPYVGHQKIYIGLDNCEPGVSHKLEPLAGMFQVFSKKSWQIIKKMREKVKSRCGDSRFRSTIRRGQVPELVEGARLK